jgi:hypothetical protein
MVPCILYIFSRLRRRLLSFSHLHSWRNYPKVTWLRHRLAAAAHSRDLILCFVFFKKNYIMKETFFFSFSLWAMCCVRLSYERKKKLFCWEYYYKKRMMEKIPFTLPFPAQRSIDTHIQNTSFQKHPDSHHSLEITLTWWNHDNFDLFVSFTRVVVVVVVE